MTINILIEEIEHLKEQLRKIEQQIQGNKKQIKCTQIHHIGFRDVLQNEIHELEELWRTKWAELTDKQKLLSI